MKRFVWHRSVTLTACLLTVVAMVPVAPSLAGVAAPPTVSGTVYDADNQPLEGAVARARMWVGSEEYWEATTDEFGAYTIELEWESDYYIHFSHPSGDHASIWYNQTYNMWDADSVYVTPDSPAIGVDATLAQAGRVAGHISDEAVSPLESVEVRVRDYHETGTIFATGTTDAAGLFDFGGIASGLYRIEFVPPTNNYLSQWYLGVTEASDGLDVEIVAGETTTLDDITLAPAGAISGQMTLSNPDAMASIAVTVFDSFYSWVISTNPEVDGTYEIGGLKPGAYFVSFTDDSSYHAPQWHAGKPNLFVANPVTVHGGSATVVDATLVAGGTISGRVVSGPNEPIEGVIVSVTSGTQSAEAATNSAGEFTVTGLASGTYFAHLSDPSTVYSSQWYEGAASIAGATPISVTVSQPTALGDVTMSEGARITGTVTNIDGPLEGIGVTLHSGVFKEWVSDTQTDVGGVYEFSGLSGGTYYVEFSDGTGSHLSQWHAGQYQRDDADPIEILGSESDPVVIDALLDAGMSISGVVTNGTDPLEDVSVIAYDNRWPGFGCCDYHGGGTQTDADGKFQLTGLAPSVYRLSVQDAGVYSSQWYVNATSFADATDVDVTGGDVELPDDIVLQLKGTISGTVTDSDGEPLEGIEVYFTEARPGSFPLHAAVLTDATGKYESGLLDLRPYFVRFDDPSGTYARQWFDTVGNSGLAQAVTPPSDGAIPDIDAQLMLPGSISGTVTNTSGELLGGFDFHFPVFAFVVVNDQGHSENDRGVTPAADGTYTITGLPPGDYFVNMTNSHPNNPYVPQYYDQVASIATASPVPVTTGSTTPGIDFVLQQGGRISGHVVDAHTGQPLEGVFVGASTPPGDPVPPFNMGFATTDADGFYEMIGLTSARYVVAAGDEFSFYKHGWYQAGGETVPIDGVMATVLEVVADDDITIDFSLTVRGSRGLVEVVEAPLASAIGASPWEKVEQVVSCPTDMRPVSGGVYVMGDPSTWTSDMPIIARQRWGDYGRPVGGLGGGWVLQVPRVADQSTVDSAAEHQRAFVVCTTTDRVAVIEHDLITEVSESPTSVSEQTLACPAGYTAVTGGSYVNVSTDAWNEGLQVLGLDRWRVPGEPHFWGSPGGSNEEAWGGGWRLRVPAVPTYSAALSVAANQKAFVVCAETMILAHIPIEANGLTTGWGSQELTCPFGGAAIGGGYWTWQYWAVDHPLALNRWLDGGRPNGSSWRLGPPADSGADLNDWNNSVAGYSGYVTCLLWPVSAEVYSPSGGEYSIAIATGEIVGDPEGVEELGWVVSITAPVESSQDPLIVTLVLSEGLIPEGVSIDDIVVFRNGVAVEECTGAPQALPDPCVETRSVIDGDFVLRVLTSEASDWGFGISTTDEEPPFAFSGFFPPVGSTGGWVTARAGQAIPVKFSLGGNHGLGVLAEGSPSLVEVSCLSGGLIGDDQLESDSSSGLTYSEGQYTYVWKTGRSLAGMCFRFDLMLTDDSTHSFFVRLTR